MRKEASEKANKFNPDFQITKLLDTFPSPPFQSPTGKDVLKRFFDVLFEQPKNRWDNKSAAYTVAHRLVRDKDKEMRKFLFGTVKLSQDRSLIFAYLSHFFAISPRRLLSAHFVCAVASYASEKFLIDPTMILLAFMLHHAKVKCLFVYCLTVMQYEPYLITNKTR